MCIALSPFLTVTHSTHLFVAEVVKTFGDGKISHRRVFLLTQARLKRANERLA